MSQNTCITIHGYSGKLSSIICIVEILLVYLCGSVLAVALDTLVTIANVY